MKAIKRQEVEELVENLERLNPTPQPTENLEKVAGPWRLLYTTISISGYKKTKLGLREFVKLGDFMQIINVEQQEAVNLVHFSVAGLGTLEGDLRVTASYTPSSPSRVDIQFKSAQLSPDMIHKLFETNYDLLLSIFNPDGWLEITYVDEDTRVGRDDKGNIFVLEKCD